MSDFTNRFQAYFSREAATKAAKSLANGCEIEFRVSSEPAETFTFTKVGGQNQVVNGPARDPQIIFTLTPPAAERILADPSDEIGQIGINIAKLVVSSDAQTRVGFQIKAGFLTLFTQGYLGVVTAGGSSFASFLASRGLDGIGAIKAMLKKK